MARYRKPENILINPLVTRELVAGVGFGLCIKHPLVLRIVTASLSHWRRTPSPASVALAGDRS
jgi:hypothetical protein